MSTPKIEDFYAFNAGSMWQYFKTENFSFWMICCYLFFEYVRPQGIYKSIDVLPWAQMFLLLAMVGIPFDSKVKFKFGYPDTLLCTFLLLVIIAIYTAFSVPVAESKFMDFFGWFVIYFLITNIVTTKERFYIFLMIFVIASAKLSIGSARNWAGRGFGFSSWGLRGPPGYFTNSGELSIQMLVLFPLAYYMWNTLRGTAKKWESWFYIVIWVTCIMTVLGASSRGSQLALLVQCCIMFRAKIFRVKQLVFIAVLASMVFFLLPPEQMERFTSAGEDRTSIQRLLYWQHGLDMMNQYPFGGVGFFNFPTYYANYFSYDMLYDHAELPHNIFIHVGSEMGYPGLLIYTLLILYCFTACRAVKKYTKDPIQIAMAKGLWMGVLGFVLAGQFVTVTYYPFLWVSLALIVSLLKISRAESESSRSV